MSRLVTLHVYSQRADPSWFISEEQERELARRLLLLPERAPLKARGGVPVFGYRGFSVSLLPAGGPVLSVSQGIVDPGPSELSLIDRDRTIERFLLETDGDAVPGVLREEVQLSLSKSVEELWSNRVKPPSPEAMAEVACKKMAEDAPAYKPEIWNTIADVRKNNNCYNYATDKLLCNSATPGKAHDISVVYSSCLGSEEKPGPQAGAIADGLEARSDFSKKLAKGGGWYVALMLAETYQDCHFYRQDASGCWSHKLGESEASNQDASGNIITDPRNCDSGGIYTIFCTFMIAHPGVVIE
jgi:hypothetical protein